MVIVGIDAGHGGTNEGTTAGGLMEKRVTLAVARMLRVSLILQDGPLYPAMIREDDETLSQRSRGQISLDLGCDFVVSLHIDARYVNGKPDPDAHGLVCYHHDGNEVSERVSREIVKACPEYLRTNEHPIWTTSGDDWRRNAHAVVCAHRAPVALVEMCFASDPTDAEIIQHPEAQAELADAIARGLFNGLA